MRAGRDELELSAIGIDEVHPSEQRIVVNDLGRLDACGSTAFEERIEIRVREANVLDAGRHVRSVQCRGGLSILRE